MQLSSIMLQCNVSSSGLRAYIHGDRTTRYIPTCSCCLFHLWCPGELALSTYIVSCKASTTPATSPSPAARQWPRCSRRRRRRWCSSRRAPRRPLACQLALLASPPKLCIYTWWLCHLGLLSQFSNRPQRGCTSLHCQRDGGCPRRPPSLPNMAGQPQWPRSLENLKLLHISQAAVLRFLVIRCLKCLQWPNLSCLSTYHRPKAFTILHYNLRSDFSYRVFSIEQVSP